MSTPWWAGLEPVETTVLCGGAQHRLRWAAGELVALDHDDPEGERTLAALGGTSCACIEMLDVWQRHRTDLDVLLLGSRGGIDSIPIESEEPSGGFWPMNAPPRGVRAAVSTFSTSSRPQAGWVSSTPSGGRSAESDDGLLRLLRMPGHLPLRLTATVVADWTRRLVDDDPSVVPATPALYAALYGRVLVTLEEWAAIAHLVDIELAETPSLAPSAGGRGRLGLPFGWLGDVWSRGLAVVAGRLCLAATLTGPDTWLLTTVGVDFGEVETITLTRNSPPDSA